MIVCTTDGIYLLMCPLLHLEQLNLLSTQRFHVYNCLCVCVCVCVHVTVRMHEVLVIINFNPVFFFFSSQSLLSHTVSAYINYGGVILISARSPSRDGAPHNYTVNTHVTITIMLPG